MAQTATAAVFFGPGKPFEIRDGADPRGGARGRPRSASPCANICGSRSALLARRRAAQVSRRRLDLRPRDDGAGRAARGPREDRLARPRRSPRATASPTPTSTRAAAAMPACNKEPAACPNKIERPLGPSAFPHLHGAFADHYYLRPGGAIFQGAGRAVRRRGRPGQLRAVPGDVRAHVAGVRFGDRVVIQGAGGLGVQAAAVAKDMGASSGHRGGPDPRPARAGTRLRRRPHAQHQGDAGAARPREAGAAVDGGGRRRRGLRLRGLPRRHPRGHRDAPVGRHLPRDRHHQPRAPRSTSSRPSWCGGRRRSWA